MDKEQQIRSLMAVTGMTWEEANNQITEEMEAQRVVNDQKMFGFDMSKFNNANASQSSFIDYVNSLQPQQNENPLDNPYGLMGVYQDSFRDKDEFVQERVGAYGRTEAEANAEWDNLLSGAPNTYNGGGEDKKTFKEALGSFFKNGIPLIPVGGSSMEQELYQAGRFAGMPKGTPGKGFGIASALTAALLNAARTSLSGASAQYQTQQVYADAERRKAERRYSDNQQYRNQNTIGGISENKFGGKIALKPRSKR